jgi:arsenite-transporting ATPase
MKLLLKYQNVVRATEVAEELVALSKSIKRVLALLTDPELCEFVGVAIPERMSLEETIDLAKALDKLKVPLRKLMINGVISEDAAKQCRFCKARRKGQLAVANEFCAKFRRRSIEIFIAPQQPYEITGAKALESHLASFTPFCSAE